MSTNEIALSGNVVFDPKFSGGNGKKSRATFRLANTVRQRVQDGTWVDGDTTFIDVVCWGVLAEHVVESIGKGTPVIVTGRLRSRSVEAPAQTHTGEAGTPSTNPRKITYYEIAATTVGVDLARVPTQIRSVKGAGAKRQEDRALEDLARFIDSGAEVA